MNKKYLVPGIIIGIVVIIALWVGGTYNGLVQSRETVSKAFSDVDSQYQRRGDLIDNLVRTVKGSSDFEQETLTAVTDARSKAGSIKLDANATQEQVQQYIEAQNQTTSSLSRLLVTVEAYPNIKSTEAYRDLMSSLEGTENRIQVARSDYNEAARGFNTKVQTFPNVIVANLFGFDQRAYFEAKDGTETAPSVDFGN